MSATGTGAALAIDELRGIDLFEELSDDDLARWAQVAVVRNADEGEVIVEQGQSTFSFMLLLEGEMQALLRDEQRLEPVGRHTAPTWMGAIPVLTGSEYGVRMVALTACRIGVVAPEDFERLVLSQPTVHRRILRQLRPVMGRITAISANRERLAALGTMAAGLAHELNNPAAAAKQAAAALAEALDVLGSTLSSFVRAGVERADAERLVELHEQALERAAARGPVGGLDAADEEDAMLEALEDLGLEDAWRLAEPLAAAGVDTAWLQAVHRHAGEATPAALQWVAAALTARGLVGELRESTERMSSLVGAVKTYAYMDRGGLVEVDLHEGLDTTLIVLGHKLKHRSIAVERRYDAGLPRITVFGSELNQVWTNLLDNAIDALGERGTITIETRRDGDCVEVDITDDGPGIPEETLKRIFEPFFTTKDVGAGTGLGLDTARRIVHERHRGSLSVTSRPGETRFTARVPIDGTE